MEMCYMIKVSSQITGEKNGFFIFKIIYLFIYLFLLYNTVLVLPYIDMNPPQVYMS